MSSSLTGTRFPRKALLLTKTRRDLRRRLPQFAAIGVTVMVGVLLFVASYDAYRNLGSSYEHTYSRMHFADLTASGGDAAKVAAAARASDGVEEVATRTQGRLPVRLGGDRSSSGKGSPGAELLGRVAGLPAGEQAAVNKVDVVSGHYPRRGDPHGVLVERHTAKTFGLSPGDTSRIHDGSRWRTVTVRGVAESPEYLWPALTRQQVLGDPHNFAVLFAPEATVREFTRSVPGTPQTLVRLSDSARADDDATARVGEVLRAAGATEVQPRSEQPSDATLNEDLRGFSQLSVAFPVLFLSAAAVAAYVLITRMVLAERRIIATFLAAGASRGTVARHYLGHGVLAGAGGAVLGVALGAVATTAMTHAYTAELGIPYTLVEHRPAVMVTGLLFGVLVGLVGGAVPAWATTRTAPAESMRGEGGPPRPATKRRQAPAWARRIPLTLRLSLRELGRSRRRTLATMLGGVLALVLVLSSAGMATSMKSATDTQFETVQREDATVTADPRAPGQQRALRGIDGVSAVEPMTSAQVTARAGGESYSTPLTGYRPRTTMHGFLTPDGRERRLPADGWVLAGKGLAERLRLSPGDRFTLRSTGGGDGATERSVRLAGLVDEPMGSALYGTQATVEAATGSGTNGYALRFASGAAAPGHDRVRQDVTALDGVVAYADSQAVKRQIDRYMTLFWVFVGIMLLLGGVLALTVIYVTMTVNIAERTGELATLRAAGVPLRRIAGLLAAENLTATALAVPVGLAAGFAAARESLNSFSSDMFSIRLEIGWPVVVAAAAAVLGASLLSQIPAVRAVQRLDVARVVRERAD
ncbi:cell division protein FtsX [Streptomyces abyssalis]|uniref:Cell division protein FtsX n=1 Tax=Streptomyces abyssalis TaxID=933944 RepID=A0A1E7JLN3_9ACTN|nr:FtsX-like permease family protein [Streptomyces abyssalis]OEU87627.1 cell division protein FtsX [Streptomyces abyssalis]OEU88557.1 cell division protein FtsX [Streptomyces abyssalis]